MNILSITRSADADLSTKTNFFVKATATGVDLNTTLNGKVLGVLTNDPNAAGKAASVQVDGVVLVKSGAAVAVGDDLKSDAAGKAIPSTGEAAGTQVYIVGTALDAAAGADELIRMHMRPSYVNRAVS